MEVWFENDNFKFCPGFSALAQTLNCLVLKILNWHKIKIPYKMLHIDLVIDILVHWVGLCVTGHRNKCLRKQLQSKSCLDIARFKSCWNPIQITIAGFK